MWAWLRPRYFLRQGSCRGAQQGSCRGTAVVPGKDVAEVSFSGPHVISYVWDLDEDLHATSEAPPEPWPNVVDGVGDRGFEGGSLRWCGRAAPARGLLGLLGLPRQGSCCGIAVVPGKDLADGLVGILGKDLAEDRHLLILI